MTARHWAWPLVLAALTLTGLLAALIEGNLLAQVLAWLGLTLPLASIVLKLRSATE